MKANGPLVAIFNGAFVEILKQILDTVIIDKCDRECVGAAVKKKNIFMVVENELQGVRIFIQTISKQKMWYSIFSKIISLCMATFDFLDIY